MLENLFHSKSIAVSDSFVAFYTVVSNKVQRQPSAHSIYETKIYIENVSNPTATWKSDLLSLCPSGLALGSFPN